MGNKSIFQGLKNTQLTLFSHSPVLIPFIVIACIQLFVLELIYFVPRYPLNIFFEPIITKLWGEQFMHYPYNIAILPKLFQYIQGPLFLFVTSFLIGVAVNALAKVNNDEPAKFGLVLKDTFKHYIHIFIGALLAFLVVLAFSEVYELLIRKALTMDPNRGDKYLLKLIVKMTILEGAPYINLLFSIFITALFGYVIPAIVIGNLKIFPALVENFKILCSAPIFTFMVTFIPTLLYVPVLILRGGAQVSSTAPEMSILLLVLSIIVMVAIDAVIYTTLATYYLMKKEGS